MSLVLIIKAYTLAPKLLEYYGRNGLLQGSIHDYLVSPFFPNLNWLLSFSGDAHSDLILKVFFIVHVVSLTGLFFGFLSRPCALVAWLTHRVLLSSGQEGAYGVDHFANIFLFYLVIFPHGRCLTFRKWQCCELSVYNGFATRVMQIHLCLTYFCAGYYKLISEQWWTGEAIWQALMAPIYGRFHFHWLANFPTLCLILAWTTIFIELGYPIFMYWSRARPLWIGLVVSLHLGIMIFLGLYTFGLIMIFLTLALFAYEYVPSSFRAAIDKA